MRHRLLVPSPTAFPSVTSFAIHQMLSTYPFLPSVCNLVASFVALTSLTLKDIDDSYVTSPGDGCCGILRSLPAPLQLRELTVSGGEYSVESVLPLFPFLVFLSISGGFDLTTLSFWQTLVDHLPDLEEFELGEHSVVEVDGLLLLVAHHPRLARLHLDHFDVATRGPTVLDFGPHWR